MSLGLLESEWKSPEQMKFTESKPEDVFAKLLAEEEIPHVSGKATANKKRLFVQFFMK